VDNVPRKIFIAGCGGMLGEAVYGELSKHAEVMATDIDVNAGWLKFADVKDFDHMHSCITGFSPDAIVNLAALTDMEYCEENEKEAWLTNALGSENLGLIANELKVPLVYISTAGIFGGPQEHFTDFDIPVPASIYAKSKYAGEVFVREHVEKYFVIRAGWMMGGGPAKDKKFVNKLYSQISKGAKTLFVVDDKFGSPTYTIDFAKGIWNLLQTQMYGVYNQTCEGSCSRYEVAVKFLQYLDLSEEVIVEKVSSEYFSKEYYAPRPASEKLECLKLKARGLYPMRDWDESLENYSRVFLNHLRKTKG